jgi:hypothetical protein
MRETFRALAFSGLLAAASLASTAIQACPLCKESVRDDATLAAGYNVSTLAMLGVLFSLAGFVVFLFRGAVKQADRAEAGSPASGEGARAPLEPSGGPRARSR